MKRHPDLDASLITIAALLVLGLAWLPGGVGELLSRLRVPAMSTRDADAVTAGYYEDLLDATAVRGATPSGLIRSMTDRAEPPADWPRLHETEGVVWDDDSYQRFTLRPGSTLDYKGAPLDINADGFRDRPFRERSDAGPRRIAIVGSSITMGSGVPVELTYENLLEDSLLEEGHDVEILNLAIAGYRGTQLLDVVLEWLEPQKDGFGRWQCARALDPAQLSRKRAAGEPPEAATPARKRAAEDRGGHEPATAAMYMLKYSSHPRA